MQGNPTAKEEIAAEMFSPPMSVSIYLAARERAKGQVWWARPKRALKGGGRHAPGGSCGNTSTFQVDTFGLHRLPA